MPVQSKLVATPADILHILLSTLPDFTDLGALILTHRCFYEVFTASKHSLLNAVGRNMLGAYFNEAVSLAIEQNTSDGTAKRTIESNKTQQIQVSSAIISQLMDNERVLSTLRPIVYGLIKTKRVPYIDQPEGLALLKGFPQTAKPSATELHRLEVAGYRFWRFTCLDTKSKSAHEEFLTRLSAMELLELNTYVNNLKKILEAIWNGAESDGDEYAIQGLLSRGPKSILSLWNTVLDGSYDEDELKRDAEYYENEGYFSYVLYDVIENKQLDLDILWDFKPILDEEHEKAVKKLAAVAK
ncbi:hypothetical protein R3P38DRAFT_2827738, partial [Favolaschia claudopus]